MLLQILNHWLVHVIYVESLFISYSNIYSNILQACLLLSLENVYPPAHQLALDMLHRITNATEEITEVLLSKKLVISALR